MPPALLVSGAWVVSLAVTLVLLPGRPAAGLAALTLTAPVLAAAIFVRPLRVPAMLAAALLGFARVELASPSPGSEAAAARLAGQQVQLTGRVADDPRDLADGYELLVDPGAGFGKVLVRTGGRRRAGYGDQVQASGRLDLPAQTAGFDRRAYLAGRGAWLEMRADSVEVTQAAAGPAKVVDALRTSYRQAIGSLLPAPDAAVLDGVVLGIRTGIPPALQQALIATGLVHLLVLSGLKVAICARLVTAFLGGLLGRRAVWPALALIGVYAVTGGATPAAVRAAAMGGLILVGAHVGRPAHVWTSLSVTAAAMTAWEPDLVWNVGFQLSFLGTAAIILLTPAIDARLRFVPPPFREPLAVTCAAQVGTAPLMAADFHVLSVSGPIANALVLPILPVLVGGGLLIAPLALVPALGHVAAVPLAALTRYLDQVALFLASLPAASISVPALPPPTGLAYYLVLGTALVPTGRHRRAAIAAALGGALAITGGEVVVWSRPAPAAVVLSVGDGEALLLKGPAGAVLVDGGPSPARLQNELGLQLPPWQRDLAGLLITAPGGARTAGLAGLGRRAAVVGAPVAMSGAAWRQIASAQLAAGGTFTPLQAGRSLALAGFRFDILSPEPTEPGGDSGWGDLAFRVSGPGVKALCDFGDLGPDAQRLAAARLAGARCDYLAFTAADPPDSDLVAALDPSDLVLESSSAARTSPALPAGRVRRTDQEGDIELPL